MQANHASATGLRPAQAGTRHPASAPASSSLWLRLWRSITADWALAFVAMALGGWLRWSGLGRHSLWVDEMSSVGMAANPLRQIIPSILTYDGHPPLYIFLVHIAHYSFHLGTIGSVRVPSLLAGILTIGVVYALARVLVGRLAALLATALVVLSPLAVWYSREGRMYAVTWLFVMLSFLALVQAARSRRWPWLVAYAIFIGLGLYSDISAVIALLPQALAVAWFVVRSGAAERSLWLRIAAAYVAGWIFFIPWLAVLPRQLPLLHGTFTGYEPTLGTAARLLLSLAGVDATYAALGSLQMPAVLAVVVLLSYGLGIIGAVVLGRDHRLFTAVALSLTLGPALMCAAFLIAGSPGVLLPRVMGITTFGLALALGGSADLAWRARPARPAVIAVAAAAVVALAGTAISLSNLEAHGSNGDGEDWRSVAAVLTERAAPGDALIYYPYGVKTMVDAYLPPGSIWVRDAVGVWQSPHNVVELDFARWAAGHPHVWVAFYAAGGIDMPVHDAWFKGYGYQRVMGDPTMVSGILEYVPVP